MALVLNCCLALILMALMARASEDTEAEHSSFSNIKQTETVITNKIINDVTYLPPMMIVGKSDGSIIRCPHATPTSCEVYHSGNSSVIATVVHGEFLFAALKSGTMLRCLWQRRNSCNIFLETDSEMTGLTVAAGSIYASLKNKTILQCQLNTLYSCRSFAEMNTDIYSLAAFGAYIYVGSQSGRIYRCSITSIENCSLFFNEGYSEVTGMTWFRDKMYAMKLAGAVHYLEITSGQHDSRSFSNGEFNGMTQYNGMLYTVEYQNGIYCIDPASYDTTIFAAQKDAVSVSFAYRTYAMQAKYRMESQKCIWKVFKCPPTVFYYNIQDRTPMEVTVEGGKVYDSEGVVIDTADADEVNSQNASAIFVMGPDGQILLSKFHKTGIMHTSSLLAGNPVSGAGLMTVERGKIKNIIACSIHYRPDLDLNKQVIESLRQKGYTDPIDLYPCTYSYNGNCGDNSVNDVAVN